jgi:hypothetical protein
MTTSATTTDNSTDSTDSSTSAADSSSTTADSSSTTADSGDGDSSGGDDPVPVCLPPCATAADCAIPSAGEAYDADNYSCDNGGCTYTGCNSDAECSSLNYLCRQVNGADWSTCVPQCSTPSDCDLGAGAAYDADNYICDNGGCVYGGCNDDAECQATNAATACQDFGNGILACVLTCSTVADCDQGQLAFDADNYACADGYCEYTGCNSDAECMEFTNNVCVG